MPINVKNLHVGTSWVAIEISKVGDEQLSELTGGTGEVDFMVPFQAVLGAPSDADT